MNAVAKMYNEFVGQQRALGRASIEDIRATNILKENDGVVPPGEEDQIRDIDIERYESTIHGGQHRTRVCEVLEAGPRWMSGADTTDLELVYHALHAADELARPKIQRFADAHRNLVEAVDACAAPNLTGRGAYDYVEHHSVQILLEWDVARIGVQTVVERFLGGQALPHDGEPSQEPLTQVQVDILAALDGRALMGADLMAELDCGKAKMYGRDGANGLTELMKKGLVENKGGLGYYRPDSPPPPPELKRN